MFQDLDRESIFDGEQNTGTVELKEDRLAKKMIPEGKPVSGRQYRNKRLFYTQFNNNNSLIISYNKSQYNNK